MRIAYTKKILARGLLTVNNIVSVCTLVGKWNQGRKYPPVVKIPSWRRYGLTDDDYQKLLKLQHNCCAICKAEFSRLPHVDHDHTTKKVRGLLCPNCNQGLGKFHDNVETLRNALDYLNKIVRDRAIRSDKIQELKRRDLIDGVRREDTPATGAEVPGRKR